MPRRVEIEFLRHAEKEGDDLTSRGEAQAREKGRRAAKESRARAYGHSSPRNRTTKTSKLTMEGMREFGVAAEYVGGDERFNYGEGDHPASNLQFSDRVLEYHDKVKQQLLARGIPKTQASILADAQVYHRWMQGHFDKSKMTTAEKTGMTAASWLERAYREAQEKGEPIQHKIALHANTIAEATFYALTGVDLAEVMKRGPNGRRGTLDFVEGFKVIIEGKKMQVKFRGRTFPTQFFWRGILRKQNPLKREVVMKRALPDFEAQRRMRMRRKLRDPKRRTLRR